MKPKRSRGASPSGLAAKKGFGSAALGWSKGLGGGPSAEDGGDAPKVGTRVKVGGGSQPPNGGETPKSKRGFLLLSPRQPPVPAPADALSPSKAGHRCCRRVAAAAVASASHDVPAASGSAKSGAAADDDAASSSAATPKHAGRFGRPKQSAQPVAPEEKSGRNDQPLLLPSAALSAPPQDGPARDEPLHPEVRALPGGLYPPPLAPRPPLARPVEDEW